MKGQLSIRSFRRWLKSKDPDDKVGERSFPEACPIAVYLNENRGGQWMVYGHDYTPRADESETHRLPEWATYFISELDCIPLGTRGFGESVSASEALEKLDSAEGELKRFKEGMKQLNLL